MNDGRTATPTGPADDGPSPSHATGPDGAPAPRDAPRRRRRSRVGLVLGGVLGLLLAAEIVVRVAGLVDVDGGVATPFQAAFNEANMFVSVDDPALSYVNRMDVRADVDGVAYVHDARGFRIVPGGPTPTEPDGRPAVAFLGDSTTYGWGLPWEDTLPALAAAELDHAFVPLNLGTSGYTTAQERALYESRRPALPGVEVVVLLFYPNDLTTGTLRWDAPLRVLYMDALPVPESLKGLLWRSALYRAIVSAHTDALSAAGRFDAGNRDNWEPAFEEVRRLAREVRADGRELLVAHLPVLEALDPYPFEDAVARLADLCEEQRIPFTDLLEPLLEVREAELGAFRERTGSDPDPAAVRLFLSRYWLVDPMDHHYNAAGNRIVARALAAALGPLVPR